MIELFNFVIRLKGLSVPDVAKEMGLTRKSVYKHLDGKRISPLSPEVVEKYYEVLDITEKDIKLFEIYKELYGI